MAEPAHRALPRPALLVITDRTQAARPLEEIAAAVFAGGCRWLSLREKDLHPDERLVLLRRLAGIAVRWDATIGVHGDPAAAMAVSGAALHLPAGASAQAVRCALGAERLIGRSAHRGDALSGDAVAGLDYQTVGPILPTASKPGYGPALGVEGLARAARNATVPLIALGGIAASDVGACLAAGATGVAVMGGMMTAPDPRAAVVELLRGFSSHRGAAQPI